MQSAAEAQSSAGSRASPSPLTSSRTMPIAAAMPRRSGGDAEDRRKDQEAGIAEGGDGRDADAGGDTRRAALAENRTGTMLAAPSPTRPKPRALTTGHGAASAIAKPSDAEGAAADRDPLRPEAVDDRVAEEAEPGHREGIGGVADRRRLRRRALAPVRKRALQSVTAPSIAKHRKATMPSPTTARSGRAKCGVPAAASRPAAGCRQRWRRGRGGSRRPPAAPVPSPQPCEITQAPTSAPARPPIE